MEVVILQFSVEGGLFAKINSPIKAIRMLFEIHHRRKKKLVKKSNSVDVGIITKNPISFSHQMCVGGVILPAHQPNIAFLIGVLFTGQEFQFFFIIHLQQNFLCSESSCELALC